MGPRRLLLGLAAITAMCTPAAVASAASSAHSTSAASSAYSVRVSVPGTVKRGQTFTLSASGNASTRSHLVLFLAQQQCSSSYVLEFNAIGAWQRGDPFFQRGPGRGSRSLVSKTYSVQGAFRVTASAHAGSRTGTEYVCAYIPSRKPTVTRAHASARYRVTG
jgi:hypothetical protein